MNKLPIDKDLIKNFIKNYYKSKVFKDPKLDPLILVYFVTFRCNLQCSYCTYSKFNYSTKYKELATNKTKEILRICREMVPALAISGGEPLIRDDIIELVKYAKKLKYKPISLFTNSLLLPDKEEILEYVDFLQISLDTLDGKKQDILNGHKGIGKKVKENIERFSKLQKKKNFKININCVVGSQNIQDIPSLMKFAIKNNVKFTLAPQLNEKGAPDKTLLSRNKFSEYQKMIDKVITSKKNNNISMDILPFLFHLRSFKKYRCYPSLTPRVYPDGKLIFPCPYINGEKIDIIEARSWKNIITKLNGYKDEKDICKRHCFLPCYLETSLLLKHPRELLRLLRS